jgi:anti-sigma-K factor RskA
MSDIDVHHLAAAYSLDALEPVERDAFLAHHESCDVCRADVAAFHDALAVVADAERVAPPSALRDRVLAEVARTRQVSPVVVPLARRARRTWATVGLAAAAAAVLVVVGIVVFSRSGGGYQNQLAQVMEQPDARMLMLQPKGASGEFKVAWSDTLHRAVLIGEGLEPAPAGKAYELWLVTPKQSMAMYVLDRAADGQVHRSLDAPATPSAWAVTLEPTSGSAVATGDIIFVAKA